MIPDANELTALPRGAIRLDDGYLPLRAIGDRAHQRLADDEARALKLHMEQIGSEIEPVLRSQVVRWAWLRLPNDGQIATSAWKEKSKTLENVRMRRNVKVHITILSINV
jgi:hypothetical protein